MSENIQYCDICGSKLENGGYTCSDECSKILSDFRVEAWLAVNAIYSMDGYYNFCGKPHKLVKADNGNGKILHRHMECYSSNSKFRKSPEETEKVEKVKRAEEIEKARRAEDLLSKRFLYDELTELLICPKCGTYSVEYIKANFVSYQYY